METLLPPLPCPTQLSAAEFSQWERDGYLAFSDVLSPSEVAGAHAEMTRLLQELAVNPRVLKNHYGVVWAAQEGRFMAQFENGQAPEGAADPDLELKVRKFHDLVQSSPFFENLAHVQERIQGVLGSLLGPSSIEMQNMALVKPPFYGSEKPWHQDDAYFAVAPLNAVCGVWIALDEALPENGCMHVLPGWHKKGALRHFHGSDCEIVPDRLDLGQVVPVPLPPGGALFFSGILPHQTPPNRSPERRRALQFHYRSQNSKILPRPEYDALFAEPDGSPASCAASAARGL